MPLFFKRTTDAIRQKNLHTVDFCHIIDRCTEKRAEEHVFRSVNQSFDYKVFSAISLRMLERNSSAEIAPISPFFLERTATAPASISFSPITSM